MKHEFETKGSEKHRKSAIKKAIEHKKEAKKGEHKHKMEDGHCVVCGRKG